MSMLGGVIQSFSTMLGGNSAATSLNAPAPGQQVVATPPPPPAAPLIPETPLDPYAKLWEPTPIDPTATVQPANASEMFKGLDPAQLLKAARNVDFAKSITPEALAKVTAGGADAGPALIAMLNDVGQRAYAQSSLSTVGIVQQALERFETLQKANLPNQVRGMQISDAVSQANPAFAHPAFVPIIDSLKPQFALKYPNASPQEIAKMTTDYLGAAFSVMNPPKTPEPKAGETNWLKLAQAPIASV